MPIDTHEHALELAVQTEGPGKPSGHYLSTARRYYEFMQGVDPNGSYQQGYWFALRGIANGDEAVLADLKRANDPVEPAE